MEEVTGVFEKIAAWWANLPTVPDLGLPVPSDPALLTAVATVVTALGIMGVMTGWVEKRLSLISLSSAIFGAALFFWIWETDREDFGFITIPESFIELVARILR